MKKLYIYIIKTFIPLLLMSFAISLFIVLMQFLFRYVSDLVGKGIGVVVFLKLMFFAAMWLVPLALILGILIASLMTYGNLGERLEVLAMKAAGISLYRIMKPIFFSVVILAVGLFVFQNDWMIKSQVKFWTYYFSIRNKSPELAIPEGVFYKDLPGFSILVKKKDTKKKVMYGLMIYDYKDGFTNAAIIRADSGRLYSSKDNKALIMKLYNGESFKNLNKSSSYTSGSDDLIPYARETFKTKEVHIYFDANMNMMDESVISSQFVGKNLFQLRHFIDSLEVRVDSLQTLNARQSYDDSYLSRYKTAPRTLGGIYDANTLDSAGLVALQSKPIVKDPENSYNKLTPKDQKRYSVDKNMAAMGLQDKSLLYDQVNRIIDRRESNLFFSRTSQEDTVNLMHKNQYEYYKKFTYPVACILFFFIGAPLGAIIRKGGIGLPIITAVIFFTVYYMLESMGIKMIREDQWQVWSGMWMPAMVLCPIGLWLTYVATKDSSKLNIDSYINFVTKLLGTATARKIEYKDITMVDPDYPKALRQMDHLDTDIQQLLKQKRTSYYGFFMNDDLHLLRDRIYIVTEEIVNNLGNSREYLLVHRLGNYPYLKNLTRTFRFKSMAGNVILMILFPIGLLLYFVYIYRNKKYRKELQNILATNNQVRELINKIDEKKNPK